ncbi:hypothetical protein GGH18_003760, partial [Coemansia sp. RSA 530]
MIKGRSMQPALNPDSNRLKNDVVLVDKTIRGMMSSRLKRGDIVTFTSPHDPDCHLVKRIIALPHDCIVPLSSPDSYVRIPNGQCWVEGDESFHSSDSNTFGPIPIALIDARVITPVWPLSRFGTRLPLLPEWKKPRIYPNGGPRMSDTLKKRRWDEGGDTSDKPATEQHPVERSDEGKAADVSSDVAYVPPPMSAPKQLSESTSEVFSKDVDINHSANRQSLAKGATHKLIMEATATEVTTRGRYYSNTGDATLAEPVLHLHVEATTQESLDQAVSMIERLKTEPPPEQSASVDEMSNSFAGTHFSGDRSRSGRASSGNSYNLQEKIFIEIESERGFNVRAKLIGTGGENMKYIQSTTGARVQVRGRGSGFFEGQGGPDDQEPMHLLVIADSETVLNQAREYCRSLVDTMHAQFNEFKENGGRRSDRGGHRDSRDRHGHSSHYGSRQPQQYQQNYGQQYARSYSQQEYSAPQYQQPAPYSGAIGEGDPATAQAAAYDEYANYCAQYYQYY